jgi:spore coat polysaccharide biosynthesis protein SpsF
MPYPIQCGLRPIHLSTSPQKSVMAFLQARMGSFRLPGKVMMKIGGRTILERAVLRLQAARVIDAVAVLTTTLDDDNAIADEADRLGVYVHRGPDQDVLKRFQDAAQRYGAHVVVRATADNPLIDIGSIDRIVHALIEDGADLCMESELPYGAATEAFTIRALAVAYKTAHEIRHREHVTLFIKEHPEKFRVIYLLPPRALRCPRIRLTVDTQEDFAFMDGLIRRLPEKRYPLPLSDYLEFLSKNIDRKRV